jgi:hypothetical protein
VTHERTTEEATMTSRLEETGTEAEPEGTTADEPAESSEFRTPPIDEDVAGSVNAALPDDDE